MVEEWNKRIEGIRKILRSNMESISQNVMMGNISTVRKDIRACDPVQHKLRK